MSEGGKVASCGNAEPRPGLLPGALRSGRGNYSRARSLNDDYFLVGATTVLGWLE